jgi:fluoride ion exporter CrcB/FEX
VGVGLWFGSGVAAWILARIVPLRRRRGGWGELAAALLAALLLGTLATSLDFGGWNEPDWRAGLFAFFGAFAAAGLVRAVRT